MKSKTIGVIIRSVAKSGMSRKMSFIGIEDNQFRYLTYEIAEKLGYKMGKDNSITVQGCGMDMAWYIVDIYAKATNQKLTAQIL